VKALDKDLIREIKNTSSRFISILILVALAVAFLSGLRATAPDMKETLDDYMDESRFMDIQVFSTLGLSEEHIAALAAQPGVAAAEGSKQLDAFASAAEGDLVVKVYALPGEINSISLKSGRMPQAFDECLVDKKFLADSGYQIGDSFELREPGAEEPSLKASSLTIVGTAASPYYISTERGTASIGSGSVDAFIYVPEACFDVDYYTAAYVLAGGAGELVAFSKEYDDSVDELFILLKGKDRSWHILANFGWRSTFGYWLREVAWNKFCEVLPKLIENGGKNVSIDNDNSEKPKVQLPDDGEENFERRQRKVMLLEAIGHLKDDDQRFAILKRLEGYKSKEIAEMLKIKWKKLGIVKYNNDNEVVIPDEGYINVHVQRAKKELKIIMSN